MATNNQGHLDTRTRGIRYNDSWSSIYHPLPSKLKIIYRLYFYTSTYLYLSLCVRNRILLSSYHDNAFTFMSSSNHFYDRNFQCFLWQCHFPMSNMILIMYVITVILLCNAKMSSFSYIYKFPDGSSFNASSWFNIVLSLCDQEVACSTSDCQGSNFEFYVWRIVLSHSSHHP